MTVDLVVGAQWGDEGKGKITDVLSERADYIVRFQGGNNAGHTIIVGDEVFKLHHLPSGVVRGKVAVIGNGCVVDPEVLLNELHLIIERGRTPNLIVSDHAHVITPVHRALDGAHEAARSDQVGTTKRGIGPTYADKMTRIGLRVGDLVRPERLRQKVDKLVAHHTKTLEVLGSDERFDADTVYTALKTQGERLEPYIADSVASVQDAYEQGRPILLEGAQGCMLDIDFGTWPYVTSSNTTAGAAATGTGLPPTAIDRVFGVVKAYTTRVGAGPFPTELPTDSGPGKHMADVGHEFGTTTGRPRRCGWLDLVVVRHAVKLSGITHLALTKLDVLTGLEELKVAVAYSVDGTETQRMPSDPDDFALAEPVYETLSGWHKLPPGERLRTRMDLPPAAREYLDFVEEQLGVGYAVIGVGPKRAESILLIEERTAKAVQG
ncbi:MAG: adenylosuccinate synthase [Euryarchaeota archaeon]|nr:adenylosuccinate synthase [Euryarchaeota archaeon]